MTCNDTTCELPPPSSEMELETNTAEIVIKGTPIRVPATRIQGRTVILNGRTIRIASIHDEDWDAEPVSDPSSITRALRKGALKADIFTFSQKLPATKPQFDYPFEWENLAVVSITTFKEWWENRLPQESRKNVRRSGRRGVVVRSVSFGDELVRGIKPIYDETPFRQGRRFWHYGKDLQTLKQQHGTYLDRADFIGAFFQEELIGFIKLVQVGNACSIMQIVSRNSHYDKRPANALLAKAVEICEQRRVSWLIYGQYIYGKSDDAPLTEFKRRNGFEQVLLPRYYVPLTAWGHVCVKTKLHLGLRRLLPKKVDAGLLKLRSKLYGLRQPGSPAAPVERAEANRDS